MPIKHARLAAIAILLLLVPGASRAQELPFTPYTPESENVALPSAEVSVVYQDRPGLIWFVIFSSGLVRYDGHTSELYTTADGLVDTGVWDVLEDGAGRLWVGSNGGLVVSEKPLGDYAAGERVHFTSTIGGHELPRTTVDRNRLALDASGRLWVGTIDSGIIRIRPDGAGMDTLRTDAKGDGKNAVVRSLVARKDGSVWAAVAGGDLLAFEDARSAPTVVSGALGAPGQNINALYETPAGVLFGGRYDGLLWRLEEENGKRTLVAVSNDLTSNIAGLLASNDGMLWVASEGGGVMRINLADPAQRTFYTRKSGLLSDEVHRVMQDSEGNLWFAQSGGGSRLRANYAAFLNFTATMHGTEKPFLPSPSINAVVPPVAGLGLHATWLGTSESGVVCFDPGGNVQAIRTEDGLRHNWVNGLAFDERGRLWIGTVGGINCLTIDRSNLGPGAPRRAPESSTIRLFGQTAFLSNYVHRSIYACQSVPLPTGAAAGTTVESLWFPAFHNLICLVNETWYVFRESCGLPVTAFQTVAIDDDGRLWVGTRDRGLYRSIAPLTVSALAAASTRPVPFPAGEGVGNFGNEIISPMFESVWSDANGAPSTEIDRIIWRDGVMWVGTPAGLFALEGNPPRVARAFTRDDGLQANNATSIAFSPTTGALWAGTNGGLSEIDPAARVVRRSVARPDGLVDNEVWFLSSVAAGADGTVYFGTAKGLALYAPQNDRPNAIPPRLCFRRTHFTEDNNGNNEIAIEYAALSYANEKRVRYKTRLLGYDRDWSPETSDFKTRYTNLGAFLVAKTYTFEVMACNDAGVWTESALQHTFAVRPAWWIRWWATLAQVVVLGAMAWGFHDYRTRALERRNRMLEHTVQERTAEVRAQAQTLQEQNVELEEKNAEIVRTQQQLIVQEKLASLGQLTAGIAHEIRNPLNFVNNFAQLSDSLVDELRSDVDKNRDKLPADTVANIEDILKDLGSNLTRINEHGKRADGIVQGMLMHSRGQKGERAPTKVNVLLDESAQLAYHGMKANDIAMSVVFEKHYDDAVGEVDVIPQDLSRVFLNIVNNACFAVNQRKATAPEGYLPVVTISTRNLGDQVEIRIRDNGTGMPTAVREKVFNPFFTTKPTGQGTGLGMSISYDIIVQEHKGTIRVESEEGAFTEFIIVIPRLPVRAA